MRYEYIEPFVNSTIGVLAEVIRSNVEKGEVSLEGGWVFDGAVAVAVRLAGDSEGDVVLSMDEPTAINIFARMNGMEKVPLTPLGLDALSELANMIVGNAACALNDQGFDFTVSPPRVVKGESKSARLETFRIPLATDCGDVMIHVSLRTH